MLPARPRALLLPPSSATCRQILPDGLPSHQVIRILRHPENRPIDETVGWASGIHTFDDTRTRSGRGIRQGEPNVPRTQRVLTHVNDRFRRVVLIVTGRIRISQLWAKCRSRGIGCKKSTPIFVRTATIRKGQTHFHHPIRHASCRVLPSSSRRAKWLGLTHPTVSRHHWQAGCCPEPDGEGGNSCR